MKKILVIIMALALCGCDNKKEEETKVEAGTVTLAETKTYYNGLDYNYVEVFNKTSNEKVFYACKSSDYIEQNLEYYSKIDLYIYERTIELYTTFTIAKVDRNKEYILDRQAYSFSLVKC